MQFTTTLTPLKNRLCCSLCHFYNWVLFQFSSSSFRSHSTLTAVAQYRHFFDHHDLLLLSKSLRKSQLALIEEDTHTHKELRKPQIGQNLGTYTHTKLRKFVVTFPTFPRRREVCFDFRCYQIMNS